MLQTIIAALAGFALALSAAAATGGAALYLMSRLGFVTRIGALPVTGYCPTSEAFFSVSNSDNGVIVTPRTPSVRDLAYYLRLKRPTDVADAQRLLANKFHDVDAPVRAEAVRIVYPTQSI